MQHRVLAESAHFRVEHLYEVVEIVFKEGAGRVVIGDFYGDPCVAIIADHERWCVVGGCGLVVYHLNTPWTPYECGRECAQWEEYFREPPNELWVESIEQVDDESIEFVTETKDKYKLFIRAKKVVRLPVGP